EETEAYNPIKETDPKEIVQCFSNDYVRAMQKFDVLNPGCKRNLKQSHILGSIAFRWGATDGYYKELITSQKMMLAGVLALVKHIKFSDEAFSGLMNTTAGLNDDERKLTLDISEHKETL